MLYQAGVPGRVGDDEHMKAAALSIEHETADESPWNAKVGPDPMLDAPAAFPSPPAPVADTPETQSLPLES